MAYLFLKAYQVEYVGLALLVSVAGFAAVVRFAALAWEAAVAWKAAVTVMAAVYKRLSLQHWLIKVNFP